MSILAGIPLVGDVIKTVFGSKESRDQHDADARSAVYSQYAAEFGHAKNWFDSFVDGMNRLVRPLMTYGIMYLFWLCWTDPETFIQGAIALQAMPKEGWYVLGVVIGFWFAGRLPKDFGKYKIRDKVLQKVKKLSARLKTESTEDVQEGMEWEDRVNKRYSKTDWDGLN